MLGGKGTERTQPWPRSIVNFTEAGAGLPPVDQDSWSLVFDEVTRRLLVRHQWQASRHSGCDEFEVAEFLKQSGAAQAALIDSLFLVPVDA